MNFDCMPPVAAGPSIYIALCAAATVLSSGVPGVVSPTHPAILAASGRVARTRLKNPGSCLAVDKPLSAPVPPKANAKSDTAPMISKPASAERAPPLPLSCMFILKE